MSAEYPPTFPVKEESDNSEGNLLAECSDAGATRINTLDPSSLFVVKRKSRGEMKRPKTKKYLGTKIFSRAKGSVSPSTYLDETLAELLSGASNNLNAEE